MNTTTRLSHRSWTSGPVDAQLTVFDSHDDREYHLLLSINDDLLDFKSQLSQIYEVLRSFADREKCSTAFVRVYLSDSSTQICEVENLFMEDCGFPFSIIEQPPANGTKVAIWAWMLSKADIHALPSGLYEVCTPHGNQYWATDMCEAYGASKDQASLILQEYVMTLMQENMTLEANCQRTWFYVNDIDNQYAGMVRARNDVFFTQGLTADTHYVASTGIGGRTARPGVMVSMDAVAYNPIDKGHIHYLYAADHLNRTSDYGVSFERGTAVDLGERRQVFISGTASIDNRGNILFEGDVIAQAERMMENIEALLAEAGCTADDIQQATVYLRDQADYHRVEWFFSEHYPQFPHLIVHAPVCRPGWLIETECMAIKSI